MPQIKYQSNLPSIHLEEDDIEALVDELKDGVDDADIIIKLHQQKFTHEYSDFHDILSDRTLPDFILSYEFILDCDDGRVKITTDEDENTISLWVSGEQDWTRQKSSNIEAFFDNRGDRIRTIFQRRAEVITSGLVVLSTMLIFVSGFGDEIGVTSFGEVLLVGFFGFILGGMLKIIVEYLHPYTLIRLSDRTLRPYVWRLLKWAGILAAILTILTMGGRFVQ